MSYHFSTVKETGDNIYFPLRISRVYVDPNNIVAGSSDDFERYVFLTNFNESFEANWNSPPGAFGQLNPSHKYSQTNRRIEMSFKLPARNVLDSKSNLDFCSKMAKLVYGNYSLNIQEYSAQAQAIAQLGVAATNATAVAAAALSANPSTQQRIDPGQQTTLSSVRYNFEGALFNIKVNFGDLIQNEFAFFTNFSFTPNFDAGVFEYNKTNVDGVNKEVGKFQDEKAAQGYGELEEDAHVYHSNIGAVYPKEIEVSVSFTVLHDYPLGWGGPRREGEPLKWAQNEDKDWPHGTKATTLLDYMTSDHIPPPSPGQTGNPINPGSYTSISGSVDFSIGAGGEIIIED